MYVSYVDDNNDDNSIAALISKDIEIHEISLETSETEQNACFSRTESDVCMTDVGEIEPTVLLTSLDHNHKLFSGLF